MMYRSCLKKGELPQRSAAAAARMIHGSGRRFVPCTRSSLSLNQRWFSNSKDDVKTLTQPLVKLDIPTNSKVASLILNRPPVNSLSMEMCTAISSAIQSVEQSNPHIEAIVVSSSNPTVFSAGLDLQELYNPESQRLDDFWTSFQQLFLDLYGSRLATIAAIEGHALAGGCMLAMACDYRIMSCPSEHEHAPPSASATIGLNEAKFGIVAPAFMGQLMIQTIGFRQAEKALSLGTIFTPKEAMHIGLVDQLMPQHAVLDTCHTVAQEWAKIPRKARVASKYLARQTLLDAFTQSRQQDLQFFKDYIRTEAVQQGLGRYLESMKRKK